jgi:hypothetical protein
MKGVIKMNFTKGAIVGMIAGTVVGVMNSSNIMEMYKKSKRQVMRMTKKYLA